METEFQIGDKVQLLRGGPVMTVYELGEKFIRVGWVMSQDRPAKLWINPNVLKAIEDGGASSGRQAASRRA